MSIKLFKTARFFFGFKDAKKAFFEFLNLQAEAVYRGEPQFRQRKYVNFKIAQKFKETEKKRKLERLQFLKKKKLLLESKLTTQSKLLSTLQEQELAKISDEVKSLTTLLSQQNKQLAETQKNLEATQAEHVILQGVKKLGVLNEIVYLRYLNKHPSGKIIHPESMAVIQNIHYLVTHNLPVKRYKIYELFPDLFAKEVDQLQQSVKKLIQQKNLNMFQEDSSSIRSFRVSQRNNSFNQRQLNQLQIIKERDNYYHNAILHCVSLIDKHSSFLQNIRDGKTVFRNSQHAFTCIFSEKLKLNLNEEEKALKQTMLQIRRIRSDWDAYQLQSNQRLMQARFSYVDPPIFIARHPVLMQRWDEMMQTYTNPLKMQQCLTWYPWGDKSDDEGRSIIQPKLRQSIEKYDQQFVHLFNTDRQKLFQLKNKIKVDFLNSSTTVLENYLALKDSSKEQQFQKLPKKTKKSQKYMRISKDQLTKMILLNNKDSKTYNFDFFAKYFGIQDDIQQFKQMLNTVSYLRVMQVEEKENIVTKKSQNNPFPMKQSILKFIF